MRYSNANRDSVAEIVDLGGGVTYEMPIPKRTVYKRVVEVVNLGSGVTYEITSHVPVDGTGVRNR